MVICLTFSLPVISQDPAPLCGCQPSLSVSGDSGCLWHCHQRHWPVGALCSALRRCLGPGQEVSWHITPSRIVTAPLFLIICCFQVKIPLNRLTDNLARREGWKSETSSHHFSGATLKIWAVKNSGLLLLHTYIPDGPLLSDGHAWPPGLAASIH